MNTKLQNITKNKVGPELTSFSSITEEFNVPRRYTPSVQHAKKLSARNPPRLSAKPELIIPTIDEYETPSTNTNRNSLFES
ncbi:unnamed protein product, partial [Rotaria sordida]